MKKTFKSTLVALILVVALPLAAMATTLTVEFGEAGGQRVITSVSGDTDQIQVALINPYLNFNIGEFDGRDGWEGSVAEGSVKVPAGATRAEITTDGEVSFTVPHPQPEPGVIDEAPHGVEMLTDEEVAELPPETRALYEILHPGSGGLQEF